MEPPLTTANGLLESMEKDVSLVYGFFAVVVVVVLVGASVIFILLTGGRLCLREFYFHVDTLIKLSNITNRKRWRSRREKNARQRSTTILNLKY